MYNPNHYKYPRTSRDAFGTPYYPERKDKFPFIPLVFIILLLTLGAVI